jgi:hypothetical protein
LRPPRRDIAAPPFPPGITWVGGPAPKLDRLVAAAPLLVHFFDFAQLNSVRALPYIVRWRHAYADLGLAVLGVHSPRFPFTAPAAAVGSALPGLGIDWPVAVDDRHAIWRDYGCRGWPSLFLWARGGTLAWHHLGEGDYDGTEAAIRDTLEEPAGGWPAPVEPLRATDASGARVFPPTPEIFPGGSPAKPWPPEGGGDRVDPLEAEYEAGGAFAAVDGTGVARVRLDGGPEATIAVERPGLVTLAEHERHERHRLGLDPDPALRIYSFQFAPAAAP